MRISDWSSDVCSSDLVEEVLFVQQHAGPGVVDVQEALQVGEGIGRAQRLDAGVGQGDAVALRQGEAELGFQGAFRSDARGVGKACVSTSRSRWCPYH